jgi:hypothetical protein
LDTAASATGDTTGQVTGRVTPVGSDTTVAIRFGTTSAYGSTAAGPSLAAGSQPTAISVPLIGLVPGTTYHAQLVATNADGTTTSQDVVFTTTRAGNGGSATGSGSAGDGNGGNGSENPGGKGATTPRLSGMSIAPRTFRAAATRGASIAKSTGATVRYMDTAAAVTTFSVERVVSGHRVARGKCSTRRVLPRTHPRMCTLLVTLRGSFTHRDVSGKNGFHFTGRLQQTRRAPGHYRLVAMGRLNAKRSPAVSHGFTIVR